jgi:hypothetical protein
VLRATSQHAENRGVCANAERERDDSRRREARLLPQRVVKVRYTQDMLGPKGNPQTRNLFDVIAHLQRAEGLQFELSVKG